MAKIKIKINNKYWLGCGKGKLLSTTELSVQIGTATMEISMEMSQKL